MSTTASYGNCTGLVSLCQGKKCFKYERVGGKNQSSFQQPDKRGLETKYPNI